MGKRHPRKEGVHQRAVRANTDRLEDFLNGHRVKIVLLLLLGSLILAGLLFDPKPCTGGDNGTYILLSRSILSGKGYRDLYLPGEPAHRQYPFGYPLILAGLGLLDRQSFFLFKLFSVLTFVGAVWLTFTIIRKWSSKASNVPTLLAIAVTLVTVTNPSLLAYSHWELTEIPFFFISFLGLFFFMGATEIKISWSWKLLLAISAVTFSFYVRPNGSTLITAITFYLLLQRKFRDAAVFAGLSMIGLLPWIIYNHTAGGGLGESVNIFLTKDVYNLDAGRLSFGGMLERMFANWRIYLGGVLPGMAFPAIWGNRGAAGEASYLLAFLFTGALGFGLCTEWRKRTTPLGLYLLFFLALASVWHPSVSSERYLIPVFPLLIYYLLLGLEALWERVFRQNVLLLLIPVCTLLTLSSMVPLIPAIGENVTMLNAYFSGDTFAGYDPTWRTFYEAANWAKGNTPGNAVVVSRKPTLFCLAAERKSYCYPFTSNKDSVLHSISQADYIIVDQISGTTQRYLIPAIQSDIPERYELVYQTPEPATFILRVKRP